MNRSTPYTTRTGVQVGCLYRAARPAHHDRDALRLQDALLGNARRTDWDGLAIVLGTLAAMAAAAWVLA